jgi:hypothetical protein
MHCCVVGAVLSEMSLRFGLDVLNKSITPVSLLVLRTHVNFRTQFFPPICHWPTVSADRRHISDMPERATQLGASEYRSEIIRILQWAQF